MGSGGGFFQGQGKMPHSRFNNSSCLVVPYAGVLVQAFRIVTGASVKRTPLRGLLCPHHALGLGAFLAFHNVKFDIIPLFQALVAVKLD